MAAVRIGSFVTAVAALISVTTLATTTSASAQSNWQMQQSLIFDQTGFEKPVVAATIMIPAGMKTRGGVEWRTQGKKCPQGHTFDWQAISLDGLWTISILPTERWGMNHTGQPTADVCLVADIRSAKRQKCSTSVTGPICGRKALSSTTR